jgi:hypothetical protein
MAQLSHCRQIYTGNECKDLVHLPRALNNFKDIIMRQREDLRRPLLENALDRVGVLMSSSSFSEGKWWVLPFTPTI